MRMATRRTAPPEHPPDRPDDASHSSFRERMAPIFSEPMIVYPGLLIGGGAAHVVARYLAGWTPGSRFANARPPLTVLIAVAGPASRDGWSPRCSPVAEPSLPTPGRSAAAAPPSGTEHLVARRYDERPDGLAPTMSEHATRPPFRVRPPRAWAVSHRWGEGTDEPGAMGGGRRLSHRTAGPA